jgi:Integrase core domain
MVWSAVSRRCSSCQKSKASYPGGDQGCVQSVLDLGHTHGGSLPHSRVSRSRTVPSGHGDSTLPSPRVEWPFGTEVRRRFPFAIRKVQTDHGAEFSLEFVLTLQAAGIRHRYIRPRRPQQNGKVERSHRIDQEEFWGRRHFDTFLDADMALQPGSVSTTSIASPWPSAAKPRPRSWLGCDPACSSPDHPDFDDFHPPTGSSDQGSNSGRA